MKVLLLIACMFVLAITASAQEIADDSSYATSDTTAWIAISQGGNQVLWVNFKDSANVALNLDYYRDGNSNYATYAIVSDSTASTVASGFYAGYILRGWNLNRIPGATRIRLRVTKRTTGNGTDSATYDAGISSQ